MTGTEKQIAWAEKILAGARSQLDLCEASIAKFESIEPGCGEDLAGIRMEHIAKFRSDLDKLVSTFGKASWWIDNRGRLSGESILNALHGAYQQSRRV